VVAEDAQVMTVVIVDDQQRFRAALSTVIELSEGLQLGGCFPSVAALREAATAERLAGWDVALMDLEMPGESGLVGLRLLKSQRPALRVVMCTVYDDAASIQEAIRSGADGYLLKSAPLEELLERLHDLARGGAALSPQVARGLLNQLRGAPAEAAPAWQIAGDGSQVITPEGERLDLRRRQAARRVLAALVRKRLEEPGAALSSAECIAAGWPGERMAWPLSPDPDPRGERAVDLRLRSLAVSGPRRELHSSDGPPLYPP
jgi:DNA-binding NarL/FixJ family response regulator